MRILNETDAVKLIPDSHKLAGVRIPFKVDLRDYAAWLDKQNPFLSEEAQTPEDWNESLEAFLAAQVGHFSGGLAFSVDDLLSVARVSAMLIVLDGLDEVADITIRKNVVKNITNSVNRLRQNATSVQVVITSRPAAFANSPGFAERDFPHYELKSIDKSLISDYANKWLRARKLHGRPEGAEVRKILESKLDQPHLRDLARNPMQLAILLSLIHTRGSSLPDKRTALYDSYMELFFNRESEKSQTVREYRDLLIDIHRYLAWVLHSEAEGHSRGSISADRLRSLLKEYLVEEGYDASIVEKLFSGVVERVVALVSRVQGTYEFEVQPLREYFAARFLYETAPYSPPGSETQGTKPDRFDAIAHNFYWLNVTRFYGGCYSKGELPSLADSLTELGQEDGYRYINHPRILAATLLADWVFAQHPRSMKKVVNVLLDGLGLRYVTTPRDGFGRSENTLVLPRDCGGEELLMRCFEILGTFPARDYALEIVELVNANSDREQRLALWLSAQSSADGESRTKWFEYGLYLGLLSNLPVERLQALLKDDPYNTHRFNSILRANRLDFFEQSEERTNAIVDYTLDRDVRPQDKRGNPSVLGSFTQSLTPVDHAMLLQAPARLPLNEARRRYDPLFALDNNVLDRAVDSVVLSKCVEVIETARLQMELSVSDWASTLGPWDDIVEKARSLFGERWAFYHLSNVASGIRSREETCQGYSNLLDSSKSLCRRARYARLRAGNADWWSRQLNVAEGTEDKAFVLLILLTWGSGKTLTSLLPLIDDVLAELPTQSWLRLARSLELPRTLIEDLNKRPAIHLNANRLPEKLGNRTVCALAGRTTQETFRALLTRYLWHYDGTEHITLALMQATAVDQLFDSVQGKGDHWLRIVRNSYDQGIVSEPYLPYYVSRNRDLEFIPLEVARQVASEPAKYLRYLVGIAEQRCKLEVSSNVVPVTEIAQSDNWFKI